MTSPNEKLATSLERLEQLQKGGRRVFRSDELSRVHRERLLKAGFLNEVMKGWLIASDPGARPGDTTLWFASFWEFCARYCEERFGNEWHLSPEQSLLLQAENTVIPKQVLIYSPKGTNNNLDLRFGTSLYDLKQKEMPSAADLAKRDGIQFFVAEAALTKAPEAFFVNHPIEAQVILANIKDASDVLRRLLQGGHSAVAGRLAGAFRRVNRNDIADEIARTMKAASYDVRESDPFTPSLAFGALNVGTSPIVARLEAMWEAAREPVLKIFPKAPKLPKDKNAYLKLVDDIYQSDAYHSLSIEGYRVTPELIKRVQSGDWSPENHDSDRQSRDALAARGYWQAFQLVRDAVRRIINGEAAGPLVRAAHRDWYRELFQPCVTAGLTGTHALAGYRNDAVYLRGSRYVPPRWEAVRDATPALFELLEREPEPAVRAVLGHWLFGYIHPYPDGNGRTARFLMNTMLASGGYPWTVVRLEDRNTYLAALDSASVDQNIEPFARFISEQVKRAGSRERSPRK